MNLNFHSDIRSKKIEDIKLNPKTNFVFYDSKIKTQLRMTTDSKIYYNDNVCQKAWEKTKLMSRKCYLTKKAPSTTSIPSSTYPAANFTLTT